MKTFKQHEISLLIESNILLENLDRYTIKKLLADHGIDHFERNHKVIAVDDDKKETDVTKFSMKKLKKWLGY